MIEVKGAYGNALVYNDTVETRAIGQIELMMDQPFARNAHVRIMPDVHAGKGCTIGTTMHIKDRVCPNLVGVDIGCGMFVVVLPKLTDFTDLDIAIHINVPTGRECHDTEANFPLESLACYPRLTKKSRILKSIGTLGGGNHFIEIDQGSDGTHYLVIHSGSRYLGTEVCGLYMETANDECNDHRQETDIARKLLIERLKNAGRSNEISEKLKQFNEKIKQRKDTVPRSLACLSGSSMMDYLHDMDIVIHYADMNRRTIAEEILSAFDIRLSDCRSFTTLHNYIDTEHMILRKGSISAEKGERVLIPLNMHDGCILGIGKGNEEWNYSAPHGAGRCMSRSEAMHKLKFEDFIDVMDDDIHSCCVTPMTLDESPMAYKNSKEIESLITPAVEIQEIIRPIYNFKATN